MIDKQVSICQICSRGYLSVYFEKAVGEKAILKCNACGVRVLHPFPDEKESRETYQDHYYDRWDFSPERAEAIARIKKQLYTEILEGIGVCSLRSARVLDVGCAMGFSLEVAEGQGLDPWGVEISEFSGKAAKEKFGEKVRIGTLESANFADNFFDAVTLIDLIEHIAHPRALLEKCRDILRARGILAVVTPDAASLSSKIMGKRWPHIIGEHLYYYSPRSIAQILSAVGFSVERIVPFPKPSTISYIKSVARYSSSRFLYRLLSVISFGMPQNVLERCLQVPMGELLAVARKR